MSYKLLHHIVVDQDIFHEIGVVRGVIVLLLANFDGTKAEFSEQIKRGKIALVNFDSDPVVTARGQFFHKSFEDMLGGPSTSPPGRSRYSQQVNAIFLIVGKQIAHNRCVMFDQQTGTEPPLEHSLKIILTLRILKAVPFNFQHGRQIAKRHLTNPIVAFYFIHDVCRYPSV